jgi:hypothetical protein
MWKAKYDEWGNRVEVAYFGVDTSEVDHASYGYHKVVRAYDVNGLQTSEKFYDKNGKQIP